MCLLGKHRLLTLCDEEGKSIIARTEWPACYDNGKSPTRVGCYANQCASMSRSSSLHAQYWTQVLLAGPGYLWGYNKSSRPHANRCSHDTHGRAGLPCLHVFRVELQQQVEGGWIGACNTQHTLPFGWAFLGFGGQAPRTVEPARLLVPSQRARLSLQCFTLNTAATINVNF